MTATTEPGTATVDVLIVGAGLSGIGAAARLRRERPGTTFAVLEAREAIGGTWDLFRYPGVRSDTDPFTMGYSFRPWLGSEPVASGDSLRSYIAETAAEEGITEHVRFNTTVLSASWSSAEARWTVRTSTAGRAAETKCRFLYLCTGYYDYGQGHQPEFPGQRDYTGQLIYPQFWPEDLDYAGKRVVVIGSGATAVTLIPAMAPDAGHVTMLQRTPSYILSLPPVDQLAVLAQRLLPRHLAHRVIRGKNMLLLQYMYAMCRRTPKLAKRTMRKIALAYLKDEALVDEHFTPPYEPWDQRLCIIPHGDLYRAIRDGSADVVTDHIDTFVPEGIRLASGRVLEADIVVSATGLKLLRLGGIDLDVDGTPVDVGNTVAYRALMLSGVPNFAFCFGYSNNSWTLRADLSSRYVCRMLRHLDENGYDSATPTLPGGQQRSPFLDLTSGYVLRGIDAFPKSGSSGPWLVTQNYLGDRRRALTADLTEDMVFGCRDRAPATVG